jgi:hypothetical protein
MVHLDLLINNLHKYNINNLTDMDNNNQVHPFRDLLLLWVLLNVLHPP